ncbi:MAG: hypothetical protein LBF90_04405 [Prevotellaceae bacterium]|nr:hypothetical protein [Prevotellaceae bacterium]
MLFSTHFHRRRPAYRRSTTVAAGDFWRTGVRRSSLPAIFGIPSFDDRRRQRRAEYDHIISVAVGDERNTAVRRPSLNEMISF